MKVLNKDQFAVAELIMLCERKMGNKSRLPRVLKKRIKRYMLFYQLDAIIFRQQNVFMRDNSTIFTTRAKLPYHEQPIS